ncbi:MAG: 2-oxo acid dehydrogenase subunit E2 [Alphaproteobacteria bacterium]|nr:2-oxo acid dehydrogenase subunit E2 [Alphaproteobacteria bacterium]
MPISVLMPALSPTMTEGNLAKWLVKEGDEVNAGDVICEIETDKATMEVEAVDEGTVGKLLVSEGTEGVAVNTPIALLLEEGEDASALEGAAPAAAPAPKANGGGEPQPAAAPAAAPIPAPAAGGSVGATPLARRMAAQAGIDLSGLPASGPGGKVGKADVLAALGGGGGAVAPVPSALPAAGPAPMTAGGERIFASPLARSMAKQAGIDLTALAGSGPGGRIIKLDIEAAIARGPVEAPAPAPVPAEPTAPGAAPDRAGAWEEVKHSNVRKVIARRLTEADRDIPQIYLTIDCEIDDLLAARKQINDAADGAYKISVNDMVIKAVALALRKVPGCNARWTDEATQLLNTVDVSVAVATEGGLITPIVFDADKKGLALISDEMKDLAGRAREGKLLPEEFQGGGFTISNLGMFGIKQFTSIINPPQACILAVSAGEQRPVVRDGEITVRTIMSVTLTCDHRVVDGALGAEWLQVFKGLIERPATMLA